MTLARSSASFPFVVALLLACPPARSLAQDAAADEAAVAAVLDAFHDAAAKADEERYFSTFAPEGVFMGTDPGERWTAEAFRTWAKPYFRRASAWTFTPKDRHIALSPDHAVAWFDEVADSKHYGACRGTGVLRRIDGAWKLAHYNLTLPIPNDLMDGMVRTIRGGRASTTAILFRHAERAGQMDEDPPLSEEGRARAASLARIFASAKIGAVYATEFKRTQETVGPLASARKLTATIRPARTAAKELAREILAQHRGGTVAVCGHSNTIPDLAAALGVEEEITIADDVFADVFVVTVASTGAASLLRLKS